MHESIKREVISNKKKFTYDEMEDSTGLNTIEECEGMASMGTAPTPAVSHTSSATVNGKPVPSKSNKKSITDLTKELKDLMK